MAGRLRLKTIQLLTFMAAAIEENPDEQSKAEGRVEALREIIAPQLPCRTARTPICSA